MCTYNLTFDDTVVGNTVDPNAKKVPLRKLSVSDRIKSLSAVPPSNSHADYKDEMENVLSDKY